MKLLVSTPNHNAEKIKLESENHVWKIVICKSDNVYTVLTKHEEETARVYFAGEDLDYALDILSVVAEIFGLQSEEVSKKELLKILPSTEPTLFLLDQALEGCKNQNN